MIGPQPQAEPQQQQQQRERGAATNKGKRRAGAAAGAFRQVNCRRISTTSTPESIAAQKALLGMSYPRQAPLQDDDADLSAKLEIRHQRHDEMDKDGVHDMVYKEVTRRVKGMPAPKTDGSLSRMGAAWRTVNSDTLPLIHLGCPMNRADRR